MLNQNTSENMSQVKAAVSQIFTELWLRILFHQKFLSFKSCQPKLNFNQTMHLIVTYQTHFTDSSYTVRHGIKLQVHLKPANLWSRVQEIIIFGYYTIDIS